MLHQAAIPSVPRSVDDPLTSHRANVDGTLNVLVAARDAGVRRLVFAGSSSAYGNTPTLPKHEDMPTDPLSPYALQKLVGEQYLPDVHPALRPRDGDDPLLQRVRPAAGSRRRRTPASSRSSRRRCSTGAAPTIYGDGEQTRDFTYVANVVDGVLRACEAPGASGEVINVATGGRISLNRLFETMRRLVGCAGARRSTPRPGPATCATRRPTSPRRGRLLGFEPPGPARGGLCGARSTGIARCGRRPPSSRQPAYPDDPLLSNGMNIGRTSIVPNLAIGFFATI